jgi:DNA repair protein RadC
MKKRFQAFGLDNFDDHSALELLLFYAIPRRDLNPVAHALLDRFGSLNGVFEASASELRQVEGLGENAAVLLRIIPQVSRRYMLSRTPAGAVLDSVTQAARYLVPYFMYERDEVVYVLCLDARRRAVCCREISRGVVNAAAVNARRIAELALEQRASGVILSHNHLSGNALPRRRTRPPRGRFEKALALVAWSSSTTSSWRAATTCPWRRAAVSAGKSNGCPCGRDRAHAAVNPLFSRRFGSHGKETP